MPSQRNMAHARSHNDVVTLVIQVGNANVGSSIVSIDGQSILDDDGNNKEFRDSFQLELGPGKELIGKEVFVSSSLAPNPAVEDKSLVFTYDMINANFILDKSRTLVSKEYEAYDAFDIYITIF